MRLYDILNDTLLKVVFRYLFRDETYSNVGNEPLQIMLLLLPLSGLRCPIKPIRMSSILLLLSTVATSIVSPATGRILPAPLTSFSTAASTPTSPPPVVMSFSAVVAPASAAAIAVPVVLVAMAPSCCFAFALPRAMVVAIPGTIIVLGRMRTTAFWFLGVTTTTMTTTSTSSVIIAGITIV